MFITSVGEKFECIVSSKLLLQYCSLLMLVNYELMLLMAQADDWKWHDLNFGELYTVCSVLGYKLNDCLARQLVVTMQAFFHLVFCEQH